MSKEQTANAVSIHKHQGVLADMADRYGMNKEAFEATLRGTIMPAKVQVTNEQLAAFLIVAKQYNLDPITKQIFAYPAKSGGIQPVVSIDGWMTMINHHPQFDGMEFDDVLEGGKIIAVTCRMYRKDRSRPVAVTEYMSECRRDTDTWKRWPARMLRHKAAIQAARYAFSFSGIVDEDEAERGIEIAQPKADNLPAIKAKPGQPNRLNSIIEATAQKVEDTPDAGSPGVTSTDTAKPQPVEEPVYFGDDDNFGECPAYDR